MLANDIKPSPQGTLGLLDLVCAACKRSACITAASAPPLAPAEHTPSPNTSGVLVVTGVVSPVTPGTLRESLPSGGFTYEPPAGFVGTATFSYRCVRRQHSAARTCLLFVAHRACGGLARRGHRPQHHPPRTRAQHRGRRVQRLVGRHGHDQGPSRAANQGGLRLGVGRARAGVPRAGRDAALCERLHQHAQGAAGRAGRDADVHRVRLDREWRNRTVLAAACAANWHGCCCRRLAPTTDTCAPLHRASRRCAR